jgi:hypothetical protein
MFQLVVPNELLLPRILWAGWRGRPIYLLEAQPLIRPLGSALSAILTFLAKRGLARSAFEAPLAVPVHDGYPGDSLFRPYDPEIERGVQGRFGPQDGDYAYAFRKAMSDYTQSMLRLVGAVAWLEENLGAGAWRLRGAPRHLGLVFRLSTGRELPDAVSFEASPTRLLNLANALFLTLGLFAWLAERIRYAVPVEAFRLAIDRISPVDMVVAREAVDDPAGVLIIERNAVLAAAADDEVARHRRCSRDDARVTFAHSVMLIGRLCREMAGLWLRHGKEDAPLFGRLAALLGKRVVYAAFFARFRPAYLWGRDDYSMDHIIRNQELRKQGGAAIGVNHGLPVNTYISQWREIDFDVYYVYGRHLYETFYKPAWPESMRVVAAGNIQMTPERRKRMSAPRPRDIAVYITVVPRFDEFMSGMMDVARHFQDRKVHFRMKGKREDRYLQSFARWMQEAPANAVVNQDSHPYDLMLATSYAIAAGSTAAVEALGFGAKSFVYDAEPRYRHYYYRNFPALIVTDAAQIIRRIERIESGEESYDPLAFDSLIRQSGACVYDLLRAEVSAEARNLA